MTLSQASESSHLIERAKNLFEFLARAQQLKTTPPRTTESYVRDGAVIWLANLPQHPAVTSSHRGGDPEEEAPLFTVDRVPRVAHPEPDGQLRPWLSGPVDDPTAAPTLRESVPASRVPDLRDQAQAGDADDLVRLEDLPGVQAAFEGWLQVWRAWADQELADRPVRELYGELFSTYVTATGHPEELELVLGVGCLAWRPEDHVPVRRHMLTARRRSSFDDDSGRLTVTREPGLDAITRRARHARPRA